MEYRSGMIYDGKWNNDVFRGNNIINFLIYIKIILIYI